MVSFALCRRGSDVRSEYPPKESTDRTDYSTARDAVAELSNIRPRRLWDLCSSRVTVSFVAVTTAPHDGSIKPISCPSCTILHHLPQLNNMVVADTTVEGCEWHVSVPAGISFETVHSEMLILGSGEECPDVLCLPPSLDAASEELF